MEYMKYKLEDLCYFEKGQTGIQSAVPGQYPLVVTGAERKTCSTYQFDGEAVCVPLVSSTGHGHKSINYIHFQSGKFALGSILVALVSKNQQILDTQYLREYLLFNKDRILVPLMKGGANVTLSIASLQKLEIEVPNLERQKIIVKIIQGIRDKIQNINSNTQVNEEEVIQLKKSIIEYATTGRLTSQEGKNEPA